MEQLHTKAPTVWVKQDMTSISRFWLQFRGTNAVFWFWREIIDQVTRTYLTSGCIDRFSLCIACYCVWVFLVGLLSLHMIIISLSTISLSLIYAKLLISKLNRIKLVFRYLFLLSWHFCQDRLFNSKNQINCVT